jgi:hypothetical protein
VGEVAQHIEPLLGLRRPLVRDAVAVPGNGVAEADLSRVTGVDGDWLQPDRGLWLVAVVDADLPLLGGFHRHARDIFAQSADIPAYHAWAGASNAALIEREVLMGQL